MSMKIVQSTIDAQNSMQIIRNEPELLRKWETQDCKCPEWFKAWWKQGWMHLLSWTNLNSHAYSLLRGWNPKARRFLLWIAGGELEEVNSRRKRRLTLASEEGATTYDFSWNGRWTAGRISLKICITYGPLLHNFSIFSPVQFRSWSYDVKRRTTSDRFSTELMF